AMTEGGPEARESEHIDLHQAEIGLHDHSEATRPRNIDSAPAILPALESSATGSAGFEGDNRSVRTHPVPLFEEPFSRPGPGQDEPAASRRWPLALVVGLIIGFGAGYMIRSRPSTGSSGVVGGPPAASAPSAATGETPNAPKASAAQGDESRSNPSKLR